MITVYELLGLVKDGKAPKKIKYINYIWEYNEKTKDYNNDDLWLFYSMNGIGLTECKVEIIKEEKKIEKLKWNEKSQHNVVTDNTKKTLEHLLSRSEQLKKCLNKVIDEINKLKGGRDKDVENEDN